MRRNKDLYAYSVNRLLYEIKTDVTSKLRKVLPHEILGTMSRLIGQSEAQFHEIILAENSVIKLMLESFE